MKNFILLFIFLCITELSFTQTVTFDREFSFKISQVEQTSDGDYIAAGYSSNKLFITKLDESGFTKWIKTIENTSGTVYPLLLLLNDGFFIATKVLESNKNNFDARLIKMDYNGNVEFEKNYGMPFTDESGYQIIEADSGNYFFLTETLLYNITPGGDVIWAKQVSYFSSAAYLSNRITKFSDNLYLFFDSSSLIGLNRNGDSLWVVEFPLSLYNTPSIVKNEEGNIILFLRNKIYKLSIAGEVLQEEVIKPNGFINYSIKKGDNILIIWNATPIIGYSSLITLESDSVIVSEKSLPLNAIQMLLSDDNGFLFNGYKNGNRLIKTDTVLHNKSVTLKNPKLSNYDSYFSQNTNSQIYGLQNYTLTWEASDVENVNLDYSSDAGKNWINIANNLSCDSSTYPPFGGDSLRYPSYEWTAPIIFSDEFYLRVIDSNDPSIYDRTDPIGSIFIYQDHDTIAVNNITMWFNNSGMGSHNPRTDESGFFWPNNIIPNIPAVFTDGLVWGGKVNGEIRVNGNTYRWGLQPGKILENGKADDPLSTESKIFKIRNDWQTLPKGNLKDRLEYDYHNWPVEAGAPWDDINEDGVYTPSFDKPKFIGDETIFYVANDLDTTTSRYSYGSDPIGLEFQTTIFGFNREDLKDVVFKKYSVINKSTSDITDMYFTYWADVDLGYAGDDYEGFDTTLNMAYCYNGDNNDEWNYEIAPPAISHMIVQGPIIPASNLDSARFEDGWKKGFKNLGITASGLILKIYNSYWPRDPWLGVYEGTLEFYNVMKGLTNDGYSIINPLTNEPTIWPLCGDPVTGTGWYEGAGWPGGPSPGDRRYHVPTGPFNLAVGDTQEIVIAIPIARGTDNINSITKLRELAAHVQDFYNTELVDILNTKQTIAPTGFTLYQNYPNPFNPKTTIEYEVPEKSFVTIKIYDILGREVQTLVNNQEQVRFKYKVVFDASSLASGVYFYRLQAGGFTETKKMVVIK